MFCYTDYYFGTETWILVMKLEFICPYLVWFRTFFNTTHLNECLELIELGGMSVSLVQASHFIEGGKYIEKLKDATKDSLFKEEWRWESVFPDF